MPKNKRKAKTAAVSAASSTALAKAMLTDEQSPLQNEDYVMVETEKCPPFLDTVEFVKLETFSYERFQYAPSQINQIIFEQYQLNFTLVKSVVMIEAPGSAHIFSKPNGEQIILFPAVKDYDYQQFKENLLTVAEALNYYKTYLLPTYPHALVVMPVAELIRAHFRLLTIQDEIISYYDSKAPLANISARLLAPFLPSLLQAESDTSEKYGEDLEQFRRDFDRDNSTLTYKSIASHSAALLKTVGFFTYDTLISYPEFFSTVKRVCSEVLPNYKFSEKSLGHQALTEHSDCGPLTIAYAELTANNKPPEKLKEDAGSLRARFFDPQPSAVETELANMSLPQSNSCV